MSDLLHTAIRRGWRRSVWRSSQSITVSIGGRTLDSGLVCPAVTPDTESCQIAIRGRNGGRTLHLTAEDRSFLRRVIQTWEFSVSSQFNNIIIGMTLSLVIGSQLIARSAIECNRISGCEVRTITRSEFSTQ